MHAHIHFSAFYPTRIGSSAMADFLYSRFPKCKTSVRYTFLLAFLNGSTDFLQTCRKCRSSASAHSRYCVLPYAHGFMIHFSPAFIITVFQYSLIFIILDFHYRSFLWFSLSLWFSLFIVIVIFIIRLFHYCCVFITRSIIIPLFMHFFMISR